MQKCMRRRKADGSWICARCRLQGSKLETELQAAKKERDLAAEKAKEASLLLKEEKKKRLQLEDKITQRLCRGGGYKLEGLDATIVPNGVVAYELEEANRHMREASEEASRIAKKLEVERQEKRDIVRQARKDRADLVKDLTVVKSLQSEFEKAGNRRTRQAESCYHNTSTLSSLLVLTLFLCYNRYMPCHIYFSISTLPCIYTTRTLLNLNDTSPGNL